MDNKAKLQRDFFNELAPTWRDGYPISNERIAELLSPIPFSKDKSVLDVACGSGVLDEYLLKVSGKVVAVDVADKMIEKAKADPKNDGVEYHVCDYHEMSGKFDLIIVFDAYPHFVNKESFALKACELLKDDGSVWIVFDDGRKQTDRHHKNLERGLSVPLGTPNEEAEKVAKYLTCVYHIENESYYCLGLKKKN